MDVAYPRLSDWTVTCLQWALHTYEAGESIFFAVRGSDALFSNNFGENLIVFMRVF